MIPVVRAALGLLSAAVAGAALAGADRQPAFDAKALIETREVIRLGGPKWRANPPFGTALFSPSGARFLLLTKQGDVEANVHEQKLLLFETASVQQYLSDPKRYPRPEPAEVAGFKISHEWNQVDSVRWLNESEVGFIAQGENGTSQVFAANVETRVTSQVSQSPTPVRAFDLSNRGLLYVAHSKINQPKVIEVEHQHLYQLVSWDTDENLSPTELFFVPAGSMQPRRVNLPPFRLFTDMYRVSLSPSGRYAVTLFPIVGAIPQWGAYDTATRKRMGYADEERFADPASWTTRLKLRYYLIDLERNEARPLLNAPAGNLADPLTPLEVLWDEGRGRVIVSNTFLPLDGLSADARTLSSAQPAIAEVDYVTGAAELIVFTPSQGFESRESITAVRAGARQGELLVHRNTPSGNVVDRFVRTAKGWREAGTRKEGAHYGLEIALKEDLNQRPRVYARSVKCKCERELFDPAPELDSYLLGRTQIFEWTDSSNIKWRGGLLLPADYESGKRYPVVVQTHGFDPHQFLLDGPSKLGTTGMAAQPLAAAGIAVLQIEDNPAADEGNEGERYARGYKAAIDKLIAEGIAAPGQIGMTAFSRTGLPAVVFLKNFPHMLAAINIADAGWWGYVQYVLTQNLVDASTQYPTEQTGGDPEKIGLSAWIQRNPLYRLSETTTAVRIEAIDRAGLMNVWEHYSLLKRAGRAVDVIYFPDGRHQLWKPLERMASQGGSVDWFRFWLQGYEDPSQHKEEQYRRWRLLRYRLLAGASVADARAAWSSL